MTISEQFSLFLSFYHIHSGSYRTWPPRFPNFCCSQKYFFDTCLFMIPVLPSKWAKYFPLWIHLRHLLQFFSVSAKFDKPSFDIMLDKFQQSFSAYDERFLSINSSLTTFIYVCISFSAFIYRTVSRRYGDTLHQGIWRRGFEERRITS